jgi:hypothetical protein
MPFFYLHLHIMTFQTPVEQLTAHSAAHPKHPVLLGFHAVRRITTPQNDGEFKKFPEHYCSGT